MILRSILWPGVILPATACGIALLLAWRPWRTGWRRPRQGEAPSTTGAWGAALGVGAGYLAAHAALTGLPPLPPLESTHWLFYLVAATTLLGVLHAVWTPPGAVSMAIRLGLVAALLGLTLRPVVVYTWDRGEAALWLTCLGVVTLALWLGLEGLEDRRPGPCLPLALVVVAASSAVVLGLSGSALLGQLGGALAATLGVVALVAWWSPTAMGGGPGLQVAVLALVGLLLNGHFYAELDAWGGLLLGAAPLAAWVSQAGPVRRLRPLAASVLTAAAALLVTAPAVVLAVVGFVAQEDYY